MNYYPTYINRHDRMDGYKKLKCPFPVSDQLKAGEINLIEITLEESAAAKERLEAHRKKR